MDMFEKPNLWALEILQNNVIKSKLYSKIVEGIEIDSDNNLRIMDSMKELCIKEKRIEGADGVYNRAKALKKMLKKDILDGETIDKI